jgi:Mg-chelatase subunit ChlD
METFIRRRRDLSPDDRVAIVTFDWYGRVVLPLTDIRQMDTIMRCLMSIRAGGGTDLAQGLRAANSVFAQDVALHPTLARYRRILLLTDGRGGRPLNWAAHLKNAGVLLEVIGLAGKTSEIDTPLLSRVATTDASGFTHYWFVRNTDELVARYENLASGLVFGGHNR